MITGEQWVPGASDGRGGGRALEDCPSTERCGGEFRRLRGAHSGWRGSLARTNGAVEMTRPDRRTANVRMGLTLAAVALAFFLFVIVKYKVFGR